MFKIIIEKTITEVKEVKTYEKLHNNSDKPNQYGYVTTQKEVTEEAEIYTQTTEKEIDIKKIIDAFNQ